ISIKIRLKYSEPEMFAQKFAPYVGAYGMFIPSRNLQPLQSPVEFSFFLANDQRVFHGQGRVVQVFHPPHSRTTGMGLQFETLSQSTHQMLQYILHKNVPRAPQVPHLSPHQFRILDDEQMQNAQDVMSILAPPTQSNLQTNPTQPRPSHSSRTVVQDMPSISQMLQQGIASEFVPSEASFDEIPSVPSSSANPEFGYAPSNYMLQQPPYSSQHPHNSETQPATYGEAPLFDAPDTSPSAYTTQSQPQSTLSFQQSQMPSQSAPAYSLPHNAEPNHAPVEDNRAIQGFRSAQHPTQPVPSFSHQNLDPQPSMLQPHTQHLSPSQRPPHNPHTTQHSSSSSFPARNGNPAHTSSMLRPKNPSVIQPAPVVQHRNPSVIQPSPVGQHRNPTVAHPAPLLKPQNPSGSQPSPITQRRQPAPSIGTRRQPPPSGATPILQRLKPPTATPSSGQRPTHHHSSNTQRRNVQNNNNRPARSPIHYTNTHDPIISALFQGNLDNIPRTGPIIGIDLG
ncbi:MAG: hypothetical protein AAGJ35_09695, partial [Myxococcota bacterium]